MWQKVKLLVLSNFSFCHNVFKSCMQQMRQRVSTCGKRLTEAPVWSQVLKFSYSSQCLWVFTNDHKVHGMDNVIQYKPTFIVWISLEIRIKMDACFLFITIHQRLPLCFLNFEDIVFRGDIANKEQFLLMPQCLSTLYKSKHK